MKDLTTTNTTNTTNTSGKVEETKQLSKSGNEMDPRYLHDTDGEMVLDETGNPIFKDSVQMGVKRNQLLFIYNAIKDLLDANLKANGMLIPPPEIDRVMKLMDLIASQDKDTTKEIKLTLPINYMVGLWHSLQSGRRFGIYMKDADKMKDTYLDDMTMKVAETIDTYHKLKNKETIMDTKPEDIKKGTQLRLI